MNQVIVKKVFEAGAAVLDTDAPDALDLYHNAASLVRMGAFSCDLASERLVWTDGVFNLFGLSGDEVPDRRAILEQYRKDSRELLERTRSNAIQTGTGFSLEASIMRFDGTERWIRITAATRGSNGRAQVLYGMKQDITEDHARWEALRAQAECDPLTGVANRARFQRFLEQPDDEHALGGVGALILFDLDGFKQVNDGWGHAAGDACLAAFGDRLRKAFPHARLVSRIGGDEFAVLLPPVGSRKVTERVVRALIGDLLRPVPLNGDLLPLRASIGLAFPPEEAGLDPQALFVAADRALYDAKGSASGIMVGT